MAEWVIDIIGRLGYAGIVLLMLAENLFPPLPSELIMPFAGFLAARGELHPALVVAAGALGSRGRRLALVLDRAQGRRGPPEVAGASGTAAGSR